MATPADSEAADPLLGQIDATLTLAIEQSRLASSRATNPDLRQFAAGQVERYTALRDELRGLTHELGGAPQRVSALAPSPTQPLETLQLAHGAQFDRVYVRQALDVHRHLLGALDVALRRAGDDELRRALRELRGTVPGQTGTAGERGAFGVVVAAGVPDTAATTPLMRLR